MGKKPLDIAASLYEMAGPIFVSLKEEVNSEKYKPRSHPAAGGLTFTQLRILLAIQYGKDQVGKLARSANVAQPAMSKLVDRLIGLGFVRRDPHPEDRRRIKLKLTPKGTATTKNICMKAAEKYVSAIKLLSAADQKRMVDGIVVIKNVIEQTKRGDK